MSGCLAGNSTVAETAKITETSAKIEHDFALSNQELGSVITIHAEEAIKYQNLKLRLISLEDSRCSIGMACIWAGQLIVTLEVLNELEEKIEVKLTHKREPKIDHAFIKR